MPSGIPRRTREPGAVTVVAPKKPKPSGRPKGRKNNATLVKEQELKKIVARSAGYLIFELEGILQTVVEKARGGDMQAAKMILDRTLPIQRDSGVPQGAPTIEINIIGGQHGDHPRQSTPGEREPGPAHWAGSESTQGSGTGQEREPEEGPQHRQESARPRLNGDDEVVIEVG